VAAIALPLLLLGFFVVLFMLRSMMPRGMMKVRGLLDFPEESAGRVVAVVFFG
jgi:Mg/Co/Ni transporter MgtE